MTERENEVYKIKLAEQAERYEEMVEMMKRLVSQGQALSVEERNLFSVAFKNVIGGRRAAWRILGQLEGFEIDKMKGEESKRLESIMEYKVCVEKELDAIIQEVISFLDDTIIPGDSNSEARVFYYKMKGDYLRYKAEYKRTEERHAVAQEALGAYQLATDSTGDMTATHPIKLGLALNFSVFYYEILNQPKVACQLANSAFNEALGGLEGLTEDAYRDSTLIMQLIRDNLNLWTADHQPFTDPGEGQGEETNDN